MAQDKINCSWCGGGPVQKVGKATWADNKGAGGKGIGYWLQVYTHVNCDSGPPDHFTKWTHALTNKEKEE